MNGNGTVLHLQKVAGISGSEAHLLSLFLVLVKHPPLGTESRW